MKVILPKQDSYNGYHPIGSVERVLAYWMMLYGIKIFNLSKFRDESISYNTVSNFYDWSLFYWDDYRRREVDKVKPFLESQGYTVQTHGTWTHDDSGSMIRGVRFWIYPLE